MAYDASRHPWPLGIASFPAFMAGCAPASFLETVEIEPGPYRPGQTVLVSGLDGGGRGFYGRAVPFDEAAGAALLEATRVRP